MSFEQFSLGEVEEIEAITGETLGVIFAADRIAPSAKLITAFAYVIRRRQDSTFTLEQARALPYSVASELFASTMVAADPKAEPSPAVSTDAETGSSSTSALR